MMGIIFLCIILIAVGNAIEKVSNSAQSLFDYWAERERERMAREYRDNCE